MLKNASLYNAIDWDVKEFATAFVQHAIHED
jgi:hypothetical protein